MRKKTLEHQWLEAAECRRGLDSRGASELERLQCGFEGEIEIDRFVGQYGGDGWRLFMRCVNCGFCEGKEKSV